jgi:Flp pilus assembly protein TadG
MMAQRLSDLAVARFTQNQRGIAATEFALILPVFAMLLLGGFDLSHTIYMRAVMQGELQKAARDGTLETGAATSQQAIIDSKVRSAIRNLNTSLTDSDIVITRRTYKTFSTAAAAQAESFTDSVSGSNANGRCDGGEPYVDTNNNSVWDSDGGDAGQGGARDVTILKVTTSYPHMFPLWKMLGSSGTVKIEAQTVLANQPYGAQSQYGTPTVRNCS